MTDLLQLGSIAGLPIQAPDTRDTTFNMLVYGESGVGKTIFTGSADSVPEMRPVLMIDVEGGTLSLDSTYPHVHVVRVKTWDELQQVYDELYSGRTEYRTVILDSLTEIQKFSMYGIMQQLVMSRPEVDPDVPGLREWGKNIEQIRRFVRAFRDLPMNAIFTALVKDEKDPRTGIVTKQPYLSGKLAREVAAFLDIVAYMYAKQIQANGETQLQRLLLTAGTETNVAKDRTGRLPMVIQSPTMRDIYSAVTGE